MSHREERVRPFVVLAVGLAFAALLATAAVYFTRGFVPGDALIYRAAGERLNAGHQLYALMPGDRPVGLKPPYWTVPLLSPPLMGVIWRPFAALPGDIGPYAWWMLTISSILAVMLAFVGRRPLLASAVFLVLNIPIVYEIGVGNVNGLLILGTVLVWLAALKRWDGIGGGLIAVMAALKIWPLVLLWWFITQRRWGALPWFGAVLVGTLIVSVAGAGLDAHLKYLDVVRNTATVGMSDLSLTGLGVMIGVPLEVGRFFPDLLLAVGLAAVLLLRRRPDLAFSITVVMMVLGSPVVNINTYALLLAALAPAVWPMEQVGEPRPVPA